MNQKMFRGYATTAAVREGHIEILQMLIHGGAGQDACEEALLEACYFGRARPAEILMASDMVRPHVAVHALVTASFRGFKEFVGTLIKVFHCHGILLGQLQLFIMGEMSLDFLNI